MKYRVIKKQNNSAMCFVCGTKNDSGVKARFYECDNPKGERVLLAIFEPLDEHQSYPGRLHGGISATMLDEGIGRAAQILNPDIWGVTISLDTKYRKPVPLGQTLYLESKITQMATRFFDGEGKIFTADGTVCVTGSGRYFVCPPDKIAEGGLSETDWYYVDEDLPEFIDIG